MLKDLVPDLSDEVLAEDDEQLSLPDDQSFAARRKALEQRVEELITENGWDHLRAG